MKKNIRFIFPYFFSLIVISQTFIVQSKSFEHIFFFTLTLLLIILLKKNIEIKKNHIFFFVFLIFCSFQILELPAEYLKKISPNSYYYYSLIGEKTYGYISLNVSNSYKYIFVILSSYCIFLVAKTITESKRVYLNILKIFIYAGLIQTIYAFYILIYDPSFEFFQKVDYLDSLTGFFINRNNFSFFLNIILICSLVYLKLYEKVFKINIHTNIFKYFFNNIFFTRLLIFLISLGIIFTKSRAGNITFSISIISFLILEIIKEKKLTFFSFILISILVIEIITITMFFDFSQIFKRFIFTTLDGEEPRISVFIFAITQIKNFIFFGYGLGSFESIFRLEYTNYIKFYNHVHNDFLEFIGEMGLIGFTLFVIMLFFAFKSILQNQKIYEIKLLCILLTISMVTHGIFDFSLHNPSIIFLLTFLISLGSCNFKYYTTKRQI